MTPPGRSPSRRQESARSTASVSVASARSSSPMSTVASPASSRSSAPGRIVGVEQRDGPLQQAHGGPHVAARERASAGRAQSRGAGAELAGALVDRAELGRVTVRLLEVVAEDLVVLPHPITGGALQPVGVARVEIGPHAP